MSNETQTNNVNRQLFVLFFFLLASRKGAASTASRYSIQELPSSKTIGVQNSDAALWWLKKRKTVIEPMEIRRSQWRNFTFPIKEEETLHSVYIITNECSE